MRKLKIGSIRSIQKTLKKIEAESRVIRARYLSVDGRTIVVVRFYDEDEVTTHKVLGCAEWCAKDTFDDARGRKVAFGRALKRIMNGENDDTNPVVPLVERWIRDRKKATKNFGRLIRELDGSGMDAPMVTENVNKTLLN